MSNWKSLVETLEHHQQEQDYLQQLQEQGLNYTSVAVAIDDGHLAGYYPEVSNVLAPEVDQAALAAQETRRLNRD